MDDLASAGLVSSAQEAELVCSILRDAGIRCMHRITNVGSGAADGLTLGGPREVLVRSVDLTRAHEILRSQRAGSA